MFSYPWGVAVTADDRLVIADGGNNRLVLCALDGTWLGTMYVPQ
jgi:hypothetical protein